MIEPGTEIEEIGVTEATEATEVIEVEEVTEMTEGRPGAMRGATTSTDLHGGTETSSRIAWIEDQVAVVVGRKGAIEMNSRCRWAGETGRRARVLHPRRRSLHQT